MEPGNSTFDNESRDFRLQNVTIENSLTIDLIQKFLTNSLKLLNPMFLFLKLSPIFFNNFTLRHSKPHKCIFI